MAVLSQLMVRDFRNLERVDVRVPDEGVVIVGENGQGKTNLLEAIYYFHLMRSVRGARDRELVRFDAPAFYVAGVIEGERRREISVAFERVGGRKKVAVDGGEIGRLSEGLGVLPAVMVSPRDVEIVSGGPGERRKFLDIVLALTSRKYLHALQGYRAALVRRNAALRDAARRGDGGESVAVWEPALAEYGAVLVESRGEWVKGYAERFTALCEQIGERREVALAYETGVGLDDAYGAILRGLEQRRGVDIKRGVTHTGPHRDDLRIELGGRQLRTFGSAGQQRTAAIALRMIEGETLRGRHGEEPVLLLDDPFAELDVRRAEHILALLRSGGMGQTILVVPRDTDIPPELTRLARWTIHEGAIAA